MFGAGIETIEEIVDAPGGGVFGFAGVDCVFDGLVAELLAGVVEPLGVDDIWVVGRLDSDADDPFTDADDWPDAVVHLGLAG